MLELLAGPLLAAMAVFGFVVVSDPHTVHIETITVPYEVADAGYSPDVVEVRLLEHMRDIEAEARSFDKGRKLSAEAEPTTMRLIMNQTGTTETVRAVQRVTGLIGYSVSGDIVKKADGLTLTLRGEPAHGKRATIVIKGGLDNVDAMLWDGALALMELVDPYLRAAWQFHHDHPKNDFSETRRLIALGRGTETADKRWLANLAGVVAHLEGSPERALAEFDAALAIDPNFSPALFNQGVVLASQGKHVEAIDHYRRVLSAKIPNDAEAVHAAAYSEWGVSLAAMGHVEGAVQSFEYALSAAPDYSDALTNWAQVLQAHGQEAEAAAVLKRRAAISTPPRMFAEFLVGQIGNDAFTLARPK